jgi:hypothetical protein
MLSRSLNSPGSFSERAAGMRRLRRRINDTPNLPLCSTNGCATFMAYDTASGLYRCPICGSRRLLGR